MTTESEINSALARIGAPDPHPGLAGLEDRVLSTIGARRAQALTMRTTLSAAAFALLLGVVSNVLPAHEAQAASPAPLGAPGALAPSNLLLGPR